MMIPVTIREANLTDAADLLAIYNYEVTHNTATFDLEEKSLEDRQDWILVHNRANHPLLVAELDGKAVAYVSLSPFIAKDAYATTVELSLYVHPQYRRRGLARLLMAEILQRARADERTKVVIAVITDDNQVSIDLHESFGFGYAGALQGVGMKFGRMLGIVYYQLNL